MSTTNSPNMNLPVATVGNEPGPNYAFDVNSSLTLIDAHNHTAGSGVQIPPAGININTALPFNDNPATSLQATTYTVQTSQLTLLSVYVKGVDLYYRDGNNNEIAITTGGSVNAGAGSITGLPSGTAGVAFSAGVFTFSASTNTPANIQVGSVLLGNNSALSNYLTLQPPASMAANYSITLPTNPSGNGSTQFMQIDTSGNMNNSGVAVANGITAANIANSTITGAQIANGTITNSKLAAANIVTSSTSGNFSTSSTSPVNVTNLTVSITTVGRPVMLMLTSLDDNTTAEITASNTVIYLTRTGQAAPVGQYKVADGSGATWAITPIWLDTPPAATNTYQVTVHVGSGSVSVLNYYLTAHEL